MALKRKTKQQQPQPVGKEISVDHHDCFHNGSWPVTSKEELHRHDTILVPGPTLQQCTGADIILAKGATMKPNLQKGKGRFLIVLPGMLSWKPLAKTFDNKTTTTTTTSADTHTHNLSPTPESPPSQPSTDIHTSANVPSKHILGTLSGLSTDTPTLTIPLPNSQQLVFSGRIVESSSRYMMLSCHPRKSTVTCKDTCQSMIVFGNGTVEASTVSSGVEVTAVPTPEIPKTQRLFRHYGGSLRAVDGGRPSTWSKGQQRVVVKKSPVVRKTDMADNKDHNEETSHETPSTPIDGNESDDYVEQIHHMIEPRERARRALSEKKVDYTQESASESISNDDNDDQDDVQDDVQDEIQEDMYTLNNNEANKKPIKQPASTRKNTKEFVSTKTKTKPIQLDDSSDEDSKSKGQSRKVTTTTTDNHTSESTSQPKNNVVQPKQKAALKQTRQHKRNFVEMKDDDKPESGAFKTRSNRARKAVVQQNFIEVEGGSDDDDNDGDYSETPQHLQPNAKFAGIRQTRAIKPRALRKATFIKPKTPVKRATGKKLPAPKPRVRTNALMKVGNIPLNSTNCEPVTLDDACNDSTPVKRLTPHKVSSPSPKTQSARRKFNKTLKEAVEDVNDGAEWTIDLSSD